MPDSTLYTECKRTGCGRLIGDRRVIFVAPDGEQYGPYCNPCTARELSEGAQTVAESPALARAEQAEALLREAADALYALSKAALTTKPRLAKPYPDVPDTSPWTQFVEVPARRAYEQYRRICRHLAVLDQAKEPDRG